MFYKIVVYLFYKLVIRMSLIQIDNRQHHEQIGLQGHNQNVEKRPAKVQGQLPVSEQSNHQKNGFASKKVSVEPQRQRNWFGKKTWQLEQKVCLLYTSPSPRDPE